MMKYKRIWWLAASFWFGVLLLTLTVTLGTDWSTARNLEFVMQLCAVLSYVALVLGALYLWSCLDEDDAWQSWPTKEERAVLKQHREMDSRERVLASREKLVERERELNVRREAYIQTIEREANLR